MKSILVVDDEPHVSRVTKGRLEQEGYRIEVARDGEEALEKLQAQAFDSRSTSGERSGWSAGTARTGTQLDADVVAAFGTACARDASWLNEIRFQARPADG